MNKKRLSFNIQYAAVQGLYWMGFCCCVGFTLVYMQSRGYSNSLVGLLIALGNIAGVILAPVLAAWVDRTGRRGLFLSLAGLLAVQLMFQVLFLFLPGRNICVYLCYLLYIACVNAAGGLVTQLSTELESVCGQINFGAARGTGSLFYAAASALLGRLLENTGAGVLPYAAGAGITCQLLLLAALAMQLKSAPLAASAAESAADSSSLLAFFKNNVRFCVMMLGVSLLHLSHNLLVSFLINVVRAVGGSTADMGGISGLMAFTELPMLLLYDRIFRRIDPPAAMRIGAVFFVAKALAFALAESVGAMYLCDLLEPLSYAVITIASVRYVNRYIAPRDAAKGQSVAYGVTTLASAFAGTLGGLMYDAFPVRTVLLAGTALAAAGAAVCIAFSNPAAKRA